ncbi:hypothetical protein BDP27DRAFT_1370053 [Rhodocollybia butyracea]|uniref:Uncharacterized protein n=1 Tax=Rhodocollybia butyracea TaxID=206335 RepID=A0A9P5TZL9_9AGAR|nr:hypothetical protein BDP27DRAFT_1370053 [Rhodocollybia butyracea]
MDVHEDAFLIPAAISSYWELKQQFQAFQETLVSNIGNQKKAHHDILLSIADFGASDPPFLGMRRRVHSLKRIVTTTLKEITDYEQSGAPSAILLFSVRAASEECSLIGAQLDALLLEIQNATGKSMFNLCKALVQSYSISTTPDSIGPPVEHFSKVFYNVLVQLSDTENSLKLLFHKIAYAKLICDAVSCRSDTQAQG